MDFTPYIQILIAVILGIILGAERNFAGKMAGMRTYGLVSMGSCLLIIISEMVLSTAIISADPLRLAAGIVTGIGFLGAGLIIFKDSTVSGLTTAAGLWVSAGIGMAVGFGFYSIAVFVTLVTLLVFTILWSIENRVKKIVVGETAKTPGPENNS